MPDYLEPRLVVLSEPLVIAAEVVNRSRLQNRFDDLGSVLKPLVVDEVE
jgi:hypothetical protein